MRGLLVGGGPDKENNTAQIEEHLRFVTGLVPASPGRIVLFADGKASSRDLSYTDSGHLTAGQRALDILLPNDDSAQRYSPARRRSERRSTGLRGSLRSPGL